MISIDDEDRISVRAQKAKDGGFTGVSILHRLNKLYNFNVLDDTVFDAMHNVALNVISQHLHYYADNGFFDKTNVELRLQSVPWTAGLLANILVYLYFYFNSLQS